MASFVGLNVEKGGLDEGLQDRPFVGNGRVENTVGGFLEGKNIAFLATTHGRPASDCIFAGIAAEFFVPDGAADQSGIGSRDPVIVIDYKLSQRGNIDFKFGRGRDRNGQFIVQAMDSLYDDDLIFVNAKAVAFRAAGSGGEIEAGNADLPALKQFGKVLVEKLQIEGMDVLEIKISFLIAGCLIAVEKIIVERKGDRSLAIDPQLGAKTLAEGRFARAGRSSDEDYPAIFSMVDLIGDQADLPFVEGLRGFDEV